MRRIITRAINESIYLNSSYLLSSWIILSGFGFVFWTLCARLYDAEQVGIATALLAALNLITSLSLMGFELSIIRVLPEHPEKSTLFNVFLSTASVFGIIFSLLFMVILPRFSSSLEVLRSGPLTEALFVIYVLVALADYLITNTFVAYRKSDYTLKKNLIFSAAKLVFPALLISFGAFGILSSWMLSLGLAVIYGASVLVRQFNHKLRPQLGLAPLRGIIRYSLGNYISSFAEGLPIMVLPILIVRVYSPQQGAYYYIAMMFATFLFTISTSATQSLFAEASQARDGLRLMINKALKFAGLLLVPAIAAIILLGPFLLSIFGSAYADEATGLLRILALSSILTVFNSIARTIFRVHYRTVPLTVVSFLGAAVIIAGSYFFRGQGLSGIGLAWLLGEAVTLIAYALLIARDRAELLAATASR